MTAGSPVRLVVLFSIPLIFGNIFQQLYYITDAVIVGKYISIQALAAVNSCTWITWLLNAIARDFSNTLSILASYSVGEGDQEKVKKIVGNAGTITLLLSLFLLVFAETNLDLFFRLFKVQAEVIQMTGEYFSIVLLGIPFVLIYNAAAALLRAEGNSQVTFHSVAVATVIAQFVSMVIALVPLLKSKMFTKDLSYWKLDVSLLKQMVSLWLPMFVNSAVITIGGSYVSRNVNAIGPYFTAGISSGTKIFTMLESLIMAIQTGLSVFIGQNLGAGLRERVRKGQHQVVLFSLVLSFFLNIVVQSLAPVLVGIFLSASDPLYAQTLHVAVADVRVITLGMFIMAPMYLYRIAIQTLGHPKYPMYAGFLQLLARVFSVSVLPMFIGEYGYYVATILAWIVTLPVVMIPYYKYLK